MFTTIVNKNFIMARINPRPRKAGDAEWKLPVPPRIYHNS
jgi:hypothetical protein